VGTDIRVDHFSEADHARFKQRLDRGLRALELVLARPGFSSGPRTLGAELELCLIDKHGRPLAISEEVVRDAATQEISPEMGVFDVELNTPPELLSGTPFTKLREHMQTRVRQVRALAQRYGGRVVPIGILPTFKEDDFAADAVTNRPRYRALARELQAARGGPFEISIEGDDTLSFRSTDAVAMEAANTAFQIHVSTEPAEFRELFNAALLLSGPLIAAAANSPTFLRHKLWHETRVALFKQAGDDRPTIPDRDMALPPRINFGNGWLREGAHELFMESVALHPPLLAECNGEDDPLALARAGKLPKLDELRLHHGTVWSWNRPVYDPENGGSLRIELRALPAGPSYDDMLANAAFLVGAMLGLQDEISDITAALPFPLVRRNFYLAAERGLDAELAWPSAQSAAPVTLSAREILLSLLPLARSGLLNAGVSKAEAERFLDVFEARVRSGQTAAVWQRAVLSRLEQQGVTGDAAYAALLERYLAGFGSQQPVHLWQLEPRGDGDGDV
jgi:gamma-glutamyl:cysteine ligase YbdK (ATP-grasp superfamily)